ncbi:MAG: sigma 54-interacting transcriptional regulator [Polyangiaceae bacterium]|nr:sigma 54-interacting transcriptional regulator [Polyangiaceae bacterium]
MVPARVDAAAVAEDPFCALDARLLAPRARGLVVARLAAFGDADALARHVERRARIAGRRVVRGSAAVTGGAFAELALRLGVRSLPAEPDAAALALLDAAADAVLVVPVVEASGVDGLVVEALAAALDTARGPTLVVVIEPQAGDRLPHGATLFELEATLDPGAVERVHAAWGAWRLASTAPSLAALDRALAVADRVAAAAPRPGPAALRLGSRLALCERSWPRRALGRLGSEEALSELEERGLAEVRDHLVEVTGAGVFSATAEDRREVAAALCAELPADGAARARAGGLLAEAGDLARGAVELERGLALCRYAADRPRLWRRLAAVVAAMPESEAAQRRVASAELALSLGDIDVAREWSAQPTSEAVRARAALVLGRALLARADLVSARSALERARASATDAATRGEAHVELAEEAFAAGELDRAARLLDELPAAGATPRVRLTASNLRGKLHLAAARWEAAAAHFARDACEAAMEGDELGELRATLNRAIALLSRGSPEEARQLLESVLERAEASGQPKAVGFALSNLAVLSIDRHEYARAIGLSERALLVRRRLGDRLGYARDVVNLVELRLRVGLHAEAEQALRFGRQALGPGAPASRHAELALATARVHLVHGRTIDAEREVRVALRTATRASDGDKLGDAHRLAARIALEDGLVARAAAEVDAARAHASSPDAAAETALLSALVARAGGSPSREAAAAAVAACREAGDEELAREAHVLAAEIALAGADAALAAEHAAAAAALRDEVLRGLGDAHREAYLGRRDLRRLARLEVAVRDEPSPEHDQEPLSVAPRSQPPRSSSREYLGRHPSVRSLLAATRRVARTGATVLVHGESGTGKELVAEGLHSASPRASGPLVKVNCAALVESLLLSELFGHERGAFTGAAGRRRGRFERASGGTLFLDEIGDISPRTQVALLRVLESRVIERVGGTTPIPVDVRIVCATHRDLPAMVARGEFREDLYYRLAGIVLEVPPLRARLSDLPLLADAVLARVAEERSEAPKRLTPEALDRLAQHRWPGNVRELENVLRAASLFVDGAEIGADALAEHLPAVARPAVPVELPSLAPPPSERGVEADDDTPGDLPGGVASAAYQAIHGGTSLARLKRGLERECIARALEETSGNITRAAAVLGMKRPRLSQLVKQYGLLASEEDSA